MLHILNLLSFLFITAFVLGFFRKDAKDLFVGLEKFFEDLPTPLESPAAPEAKPKA